MRRGLRYPKVIQYIRPEIEPEVWFTGIVLLADLVAGDYVLSGVSEDPDDDKYLAAAVEGRATFLGGPSRVTSVVSSSVTLYGARVRLRNGVAKHFCILTNSVVRGDDLPALARTVSRKAAARTGFPLRSR